MCGHGRCSGFLTETDGCRIHVIHDRPDRSVFDKSCEKHPYISSVVFTEAGLPQAEGKSIANDQ